MHPMEVCMTKSAMVHARLEPNLKEETEAILAKIGLTMTAAMSLFCRQIVMRKGIPFDVEIPNRETRKAINEARKAMKKPGKYKDAASVFAALHED